MNSTILISVDCNTSYNLFIYLCYCNCLVAKKNKLIKSWTSNVIHIVLVMQIENIAICLVLVLFVA